MKRTRQPRFELPPAAHEATRFGANVLAALENRDARDQGRRVALGPLHQTLAARREVVHDLGRVQAQPVEVGQVDVGPLALPTIPIARRSYRSGATPTRL